MMTSPQQYPDSASFDAVSSSGGPVGIRAASPRPSPPRQVDVSRLIGDPPLSGVGEIWCGGKVIETTV